MPASTSTSAADSGGAASDQRSSNSKRSCPDRRYSCAGSPRPSPMTPSCGGWKPLELPASRTRRRSPVGSRRCSTSTGPLVCHGVCGRVRASTLPFPLHAGHWQLQLTLLDGRWSDVERLTIEIVAPGGSVVHRVGRDETAYDDDRTLVWELEQPLPAVRLDEARRGRSGPTSCAPPHARRPSRGFARSERRRSSRRPHHQVDT